MFEVQKRGNSLGIRIPKSLAVKVGLEVGSEVDLDVEDGHFVIKPKSANLDELLSRVTPENLHRKVFWFIPSFLKISDNHKKIAETQTGEGLWTLR
ncbi:AbrB/MazE/SpoVT family DNA-binding domain-containing protein [Paenibacillus hodogayensis]|uniref:AbrB/MazE/SpoVT family DNA-binding domain-containing protein n=1 Tax=Paenibacillus hodogayensis TaxID=279208 RepID=A0ABV5VVW9_9BACL